MEALTAVHLFSFVPVVAFGGVIWFERHRRTGGRIRTAALFRSLVIMAALGVFQTLAWAFRGGLPLDWPQLFVVSGSLYALALLLLEYSIHAQRIEESFLSQDFHRGLRGLKPLVIAAGALVLLVLTAAVAWRWNHSSFPLNLFLTSDVQSNPILSYNVQMTLAAAAWAVLVVAIALFAALKLFNLQQGVIRQRSYPFFALIGVTAVLMVDVLRAGPAPSLETAYRLPLPWFFVLNSVYLVRLVEEFFLWSQSNLRSDRTRVEQRQHAQNLLIRRVIGAAEDEDRRVVAEVMQAALEKMRGRLVIAEYGITGMAAYRVAGSVLRVEDACHVLGYCTPLVDHKSIKNLDKAKLNDQIVRTTYEAADLQRPDRSPKDWGTRLVREAVTTRSIAVTAELPEGLKGLQRLAGVVPVFDADTLAGFLVVFKDSFDRLYPTEHEVLGELTETLATVWALISGKEVQKERNRLQGEMASARTIQTSILPRRIDIPGYRVATFMETATEVGGDVYDAVATPFGTYLGIGDVAGHGLPAGMMAVISVAALHGALDASRVLGFPLPMEQVYDTVNRVLCTLNRDRIGSDKFMTQNYFLINGGRFDHVGTHLVAAVWRAGEQTVEELPGLTDKTGFLGISELVVSHDSLGTFTLASGDVLVLYSDGVSEARNAGGAMFGLEGIKRCLAEHAGQPPEALIAAVLESLRRFAAPGDLKKHGGRFADDVSLVVLSKD